MAKERASQTTINEVNLLVHPFYSASRVLYSLETGKVRSIRPTKEARETMKFLSGRWGQAISHTAGNPQAILIIITPFLEKGKKIHPRFFDRTQWYFEQFNRLMLFANKQLGNRLMVFDGTVDSKKIHEALKKRGFKIQRKALRGKSFGEWWRECVHEETRRLAKSLKVPLQRIRPVEGLSVRHNLPIDFEGSPTKSKKAKRMPRG